MLSWLTADTQPERPPATWRVREGEGGRQQHNAALHQSTSASAVFCFEKGPARRLNGEWGWLMIHWRLDRSLASYVEVIE